MFKNVVDDSIVVVTRDFRFYLIADLRKNVQGDENAFYVTSYFPDCLNETIEVYRASLDGSRLMMINVAEKKLLREIKCDFEPVLYLTHEFLFLLERQFMSGRAFLGCSFFKSSSMRAFSCIDGREIPVELPDTFRWDDAFVNVYDRLVLAGVNSEMQCALVDGKIRPVPFEEGKLEPHLPEVWKNFEAYDFDAGKIRKFFE